MCEQNPVLVPVVAPLNIKLPKPVDTCITKEIVLPRVKCQKVSTPPTLCQLYGQKFKTYVRRRKETEKASPVILQWWENPDVPVSVPKIRSPQEVTQRYRLSWLTNRALVLSPEGGSFGVSANKYSCTQEPK